MNNQSEKLDKLIKKLDWCSKRLVIVTLILGAAFAFVFRNNITIEILLVTSFYVSANTVAFGALLVAYLEFKRRGSIGTVFFFGSFGIVVIGFSAFLINHLLFR
jgi:hypothetical protein